MTLLILSILALIGIIVLIYDNATLTYKKAYYEQTLKNNKDKFSPERWNQIEDVMKKKSPF